MDLATIGARYLKHTGQLKNLDESDEINACTVKIKVDVDGKDEDWLFLFKNETPPDGNGAVRRRGNLHRRSYPRPAVGQRICLSGNACYRCGRPVKARKRNHAR